MSADWQSVEADHSNIVHGCCREKETESWCWWCGRCWSAGQRWGTYVQKFAIVLNRIYRVVWFMNVEHLNISHVDTWTAWMLHVTGAVCGKVLNAEDVNADAQQYDIQGSCYALQFTKYQLFWVKLQMFSPKKSSLFSVVVVRNVVSWRVFS